MSSFFQKQPILGIPVATFSKEGATCSADLFRGECLELLSRLPAASVDLIAVAAVIRSSKWRFRYGRIVCGRLKKLEIDEVLIERIAIQVTVEAPKPVALDPGILKQVVTKLKALHRENPTVGDVVELRQGRATAVAAHWPR